MRFPLNSVLLALIVAAALQSPALARVKVQDSVTVDAKPESVWKALMEYQRDEKTFNKKLLASNEDTVTIKEEFMKLPVVGTQFINYVEVSHQDAQRIDYKLTGSKVLTLFEGSWIIEPNKNGGGVTLTLITEIDTWVPAPFKNKLLRSNTLKGMVKRLAFVKDRAEHPSVSKSPVNKIALN